MKKRLVLWVLTLLCTVTMINRAAHAQVQVAVDEVPVVFTEQDPLVEQNGRVLVPVRGVFENLGADVLYNEQTRTVTASRGDTTIRLPLDSNRAMIGDREMTLDAPTTITNGSVLVPLRFVSEALGARVVWNPTARMVSVYSEAEASARGAMTAEPLRSPQAGSAPTPAAAAQAEEVQQDSTLLRWLPWIAGALMLAAALIYFSARPKRGRIIAAVKGGATGSRLDKSIEDTQVLPKKRRK